MHDPKIEGDLFDLLAVFDPRYLARGQRLALSGAVTDIRTSGDTRLIGNVRVNTRRYEPEIDFAKEGVNFLCDCDEVSDEGCPHVVALLLAWLGKTNLPIDPSEPPIGIKPALPNQVDETAGRFLFPRPSIQEIRADWEKRIGPLTVTQMRDLAAAYQVKLKGIKRDEVLQGMLDVLCDPQRLGALLEQLPQDTRQVLDLIIIFFNRTPTFSNLEVLEPYLQAALQTGARGRPVQQCLDDLQRLGLLNPSQDFDQAVVPLALQAQLRANPALFQPFSGQPARISTAQPFRFIRLALRTLLLAQGGWLKASPPPNRDRFGWAFQTKAVSSGEAKVELELPYLQEEIRRGLAQEPGLPLEQVDLAARLLEAGELWPAGQPEKLSDRLDDWLQLSPQQQARRLFTRALLLPAPWELAAPVSGQPAVFAREASSGTLYALFQSGLVMTRLHLARLLLYAPAGQWLSVDSILRLFHGMQPNWSPELTSRQKDGYNKRSWQANPVWAKLGQRKADLLQFEDWHASLGQFHLSVLVKTLHWLGLLDVGWQNDQPCAVRLSEFGEFLLEGRADFALPEAEPAARSLQALPSGALQLDPDRAAFDTIRLLVQVAVPQPAGGQARGSLPNRFTFALSDEGLGRAFDAGWTLEQVQARLEASRARPCPPHCWAKSNCCGSATGACRSMRTWRCSSSAMITACPNCWLPPASARSCCLPFRRAWWRYSPTRWTSF